MKITAMTPFRIAHRFAPRYVCLTALILICNAVAGFSDETVAVTKVVADYPGKPAPIMLSPFAAASLAAAPGSTALGPLEPPSVETDSQRSFRLAAETVAGVAGIFASPECVPDAPVRLVSCDDTRPEASRQVTPFR